MHLTRVFGWVDVVHAGRGAALDLILQARPLAAFELAIGTGPKLKMLLDQVQRAACRGRRMVRPDVTRCGWLWRAHQLEPRPSVLGRQTQAEVRLVGAQLDVEARLGF